MWAYSRNLGKGAFFRRRHSKVKALYFEDNFLQKTFQTFGIEENSLDDFIAPKRCPEKFLARLFIETKIK